MFEIFVVNEASLATGNAAISSSAETLAIVASFGEVVSMPMGEVTPSPESLAVRLSPACSGVAALATTGGCGAGTSFGEVSVAVVVGGVCVVDESTPS